MECLKPLWQATAPHSRRSNLQPLQTNTALTTSRLALVTRRVMVSSNVWCRRSSSVLGNVQPQDMNQAQLCWSTEPHPLLPAYRHLQSYWMDESTEHYFQPNPLSRTLITRLSESKWWKTRTKCANTTTKLEGIYLHCHRIRESTYKFTPSVTNGFQQPLLKRQ